MQQFDLQTQLSGDQSVLFPRQQEITIRQYNAQTFCSLFALTPDPFVEMVHLQRAYLAQPTSPGRLP